MCRGMGLLGRGRHRRSAYGQRWPCPHSGDRLCCSSSCWEGKEHLVCLRLLSKSWMTWLRLWASPDYSTMPEGSQESRYVCFTILLLLKDCDMQLYVWHGWHIQHKTRLDLIYIHIKCQETDWNVCLELEMRRMYVCLSGMCNCVSFLLSPTQKFK